MRAFEVVEETSKRLMRDLAEFEAGLVRAKEEKVPSAGLGSHHKLEVSLDLVLTASTLLISLINLKVKLNRVVEEEGAFSLTATKRQLNSELTDIIQSVRTALSSLTERNRTLRDLNQAISIKASREGVKVEG